MKYKMTNILLIQLLIIALCSCNGKSKEVSTDSSAKEIADTSKSNIRRTNDSNKRDTVVEDSESILPRTQAEERELLIKEYDQTKTIDSIFIDRNDTLDFNLTFYCLKTNNLTVPKSYDTDKKNPKEFVTHPFSSNIVLIHNRDTVMKRQFKASDFNPFFNDNFGGDLKKYGSISMPHLSRKNKDKSQIVIDYPIAIPATDIGQGMFLIISKKGDYKIVEHY
jgi:hypothetical protein